MKNQLIRIALLLALIAHPRLAFAALLPNWIGRTQGIGVSARMIQLGAAKGMGQGALNAGMQNQNALIKVIGPMLYGSLFSLGCRIGRPDLPFLFAACVGVVAQILILLLPRSVWRCEAVRTQVMRK